MWGVICDFAIVIPYSALESPDLHQDYTVSGMGCLILNFTRGSCALHDIKCQRQSIPMMCRSSRDLVANCIRLYMPTLLSCCGKLRISKYQLTVGRRELHRTNAS